MADLRDMMNRADEAWNTGRHALAQFFYRSIAAQPANNTAAVFSPAERSLLRERLHRYASAVRATEEAFDSFYYYQDMPAVKELISKGQNYVAGMPRLHDLNNGLNVWLEQFNGMRACRRERNWQKLRAEAQLVQSEFPSNQEAAACLQLSEEGERFEKRMHEFVTLIEENGKGIDGFEENVIERVFAASRALDELQREAHFQEDLAPLFSQARIHRDTLDSRAADALYFRVTSLVKCRKTNEAQKLLAGTPPAGDPPSKGTKGARALWLEARGTPPPPTALVKDRLRAEHKLAMAAFGDDEDLFPKDLGATIVDALLVYADDILRRLVDALSAIKEFGALHRWSDGLEITVRLQNYFPAGEGSTTESEIRAYINRAAEVERNLRAAVGQKKDVSARKLLAGEGEKVLTIESVHYWRREIGKLASRRRARNLLIAATALGLVAAYLILTM